MKKVINLTKALGVLALLLLSQAMFAQKTGPSGGTVTNPSTPVDLYVTPEAGQLRVENKLYQLLGTLKQNQGNPGSAAYADAKVRDQYYRIVLAYLSEGNAVSDAVAAASRKMYAVNPNIQKSLLVTLKNEALLLLRI